jgi:hypothetical protein
VIVQGVPLNPTTLWKKLGFFTINTDQQAFYKIQPLFHALILVIEDPIHDYTKATRENSI